MNQLPGSFPAGASDAIAAERALWSPFDASKLSAAAHDEPPKQQQAAHHEGLYPELASRHAAAAARHAAAAARHANAAAKFAGLRLPGAAEASARLRPQSGIAHMHGARFGKFYVLNP